MKVGDNSMDHRNSFLRWLRRFPFAVLLLLFSAAVFIAAYSLYTAAGKVASQTRTIIGHNLDPTPWHPFNKDPQPHTPATILRCSYLSCLRLPSLAGPPSSLARRPRNRRSCPYFFRSIHRDLLPWRSSRISRQALDGARRHAAMRVVIVGGRRLYVDLYYACGQPRAMFTVWGLLQLLRRYPGMVPDVDMMFDCMDRPMVERGKYYDGGGGNPQGLPPAPPLFRYCTTKEHLDVPFPDWSFWGWPEINIKSWEEEFKSIKLGSQSMTWKQKEAAAYWKGNPYTAPIRGTLLTCNDTKMWGAQIMRQDWGEEARAGFKKSELGNQCDHRYKIYAEGFAWSVSLKYILACGSLPLIIDSQYEDFLTRGLVPKKNYWPISADNLCQNIKDTVDWGNQHPSEAEAVGKKAQELMEELDMDRVYDYMYHLILEYSKLQDFKPAPPPNAQEVCMESVLCLADDKQKQFLERSYASPATYVPCALSLP